ncbi:MAG: hypothetical protein ACXWC6_04280 [Ramlibacter sp.]
MVLVLYHSFCGHIAIAGGRGERMPSEQELGMAAFQDRHVATIAKRLFG